MKAFRVEGVMLMGDRKAPFSMETVAADDAGARERILSTLGSRHRLNRRHVQVAKVTPLAKEQVTDPAVEHRLSLSG